MREVEQIRQNLDRISSGLQAIYELDSAHKRLSAPDFNLLRVLGLERREVTTHSAFIAELLSPKGTHGQGMLGIETFFRLLRSRYPELAAYEWLGGVDGISDWEVRKEPWIAVNERVRRLDLVLTSRSKPLLVVIENKIEAEDQPGQLRDYAQWLSHQAEYSHRTLLIYLTLDGKPSGTGVEGSYKCLSYRDDIKAWLEDLRNRVQASHVRIAIDHYLAILPVLVSSERTDVMPDAQCRNAIVSFMRNPSILRDAYEISERLEETKDALVREFWKELESALRSDPRIKGWTVRFFKPSPTSKTTIQVYPESCIDAPSIYFCVEDDGRPLDCGVFWDLQKNAAGKPGMDELNLSAPDWRGDNPWWVARKPLTERSLREKMTILGQGLMNIQKAAAESIGALMEHCGAKVRELALKQTARTP